MLTLSGSPCVFILKSKPLTAACTVSLQTQHALAKDMAAQWSREAPEASCLP